jgi:hypothetical protein
MCPKLRFKTVVVLIVGIFIARNAWAQARKTSVSCTADSSGNVTVSFKISGVGNGNLCVVSSGTFTADCACENGGGNCPSDAKKQSTAVSSSTGQAFASTNGQIKGTELLVAPNESACNLTCPSGQDPLLAELIEPQPVTVNVFAPGDFTQTGSTCTANDGATPVKTGSCSVHPQAIIFDQSCAALF